MAGLAEGDAGSDVLCVAVGVDRVLGEYCSSWLSGHSFPSLNVRLDKGTCPKNIPACQRIPETISGLIAGSVHSSKKKNTNVGIQVFLISVIPHVAIDFLVTMS